MLPKKYRLLIQEVVGKKSLFVKRSDIFLLKFFTPRYRYSRFGVVVTARVASGAVERNRIRRRAYGAFHRCPTLKSPWDILLIASPAITQAPETEIALRLKEAFHNV